MKKIKKDDFLFWLVAKLPVRIIYFCFIHVMAYATSGKYKSTIVPELTGMEAIKRYIDDKGI